MLCRYVIPFIVLVITSSINTATAVTSTTVSTMLNNARLARIVSFIPSQVPSVADIGGDHGILSVMLAHKAPKCNVYCIDISAAALKGATHLVTSSPKDIQQRISLIEGNGLQPLLRDNLSVDNVIIAGLGAETVYSIVSNGKANGGLTDEEEMNDKCDFPIDSDDDFSMLDRCNVSRLIIQPTPTYIQPLQSIYYKILKNGWTYEHQAIDHINKQFHISTSFVRSDTATNRVSYAGVFSASPLVKRCLDKTLEDNQLTAWLPYLQKQKETLVRKVQYSTNSRYTYRLRSVLDIIDKQLSIY